MSIPSPDPLRVSLSSETLTKLDELARQARRTPSVLASEVISDYVTRELEIVASIQNGLADRDSGRITPHDQAMKRLKETIERAKSNP